jgi:hypothetical protein
VQEHGSGRPPGAVVIRARRTGTVIFGLLTVLWILALAASESAQPTTSGRIEAGVLFGIFLVLSVVGWLGSNRGRHQLEVRSDAIVTRPGANDKPFTLTRDPGDTLRILPRFKVEGAVRPPRLLFLGTGGFITLRGFSLDEVKRACEAHGWRFDGDPSLAVRDVQGWLHQGRSVEAVQLIELFGPFSAAAADGEKNTGLEAAVFEDFGDKIMRKTRSGARDAYRRAASAQRAFAGCAPSESESAARMAEADRIDGKLRD